MKSYKTFKDDVCIQMTHEEAIGFIRQTGAYTYGNMTQELVDTITQTYLLNGIDIHAEIVESLRYKGQLSLDIDKKT